MNGYQVQHVVIENQSLAAGRQKIVQKAGALIITFTFSFHSKVRTRRTKKYLPLL